MKNSNTIQKINSIGNVGSIVLSIMRILVIIGIVATIAGGIISLAAIPSASKDKNLMNLNGSADITITMDDNAINSALINTTIESDNFNFDMFGIKMKLEEMPLKDGKSGAEYTLDLDNVEVSPVTFALVMAGFCFGTALVLGACLVMVIFAKKMADAFKTCNSPFEANVITAMKHFGYSMIPWGIVFGLFSDSLIMTVLLVLVVLAIIYIFSYGAELQQESDDTV